MVREIPLTQGKVALVDDEDYEWLSKYKWRANKKSNGYYATTLEKNNHKCIKMHRLILNPKNTEEVDHINRDGLDNRRCNIRVVTHAQNMMNCIKHPGTSSKYKGVTWRKDNNLWRVLITINKKTISLGQFKNEIDAARTYDEAAKNLFGEYARVNLYDSSP